MTQPVLLFGANGQLGKRLCNVLGEAGYDVTAIDRAACDFATVELKKIETMLRAVEPSIIINAAAYTAVDKAESEPALAERVNAKVPQWLAQTAQAQHIPFVHFSTDYVFDGARGAPYKEEAAVRPLNIYGASKLAGEQAVLAAQSYVFRLQWVYDTSGQNFFLTMKKLLAQCDQLRVVADQIGAPSYALHVAQAVEQILPLIDARKLPAGVYHLAAGGITSWHGFACAIRDAIGSAAQITPIMSEEYPQAATRPKDTRLDCRALAAYGIAMPHWTVSLAAAHQESA